MQIIPDKLKVQIDAAISNGMTKKDITEAAGWGSVRRLDQLLNGKCTNLNPRIGEAIAKKLKCKTADISA